MKGLKRILAFIMSAVILCTMTAVITSADTSTAISADADKTSCKVGDTVKINLSLSGNSGFSAFQCAFKYDCDVFEYVGYTAVTGFAEMNDCNINTPGTVDMILSVLLGDDITENGIYGTLEFKAVKSGISDFSINVDTFNKTNDDTGVSTELPYTISGTSVNVDSDVTTTDDSTITTTTTATTTEATTETTTKAPVTQATTEKATEATTKAPVTQATTEKATETTTKAIVNENTTETTTTARRTGGGGGGSSRTASVTTTTTESITESVTEESSEETTQSVISNDVKVTIGAKKVVIGSKTYDVDVAPYIQTSSNSTLVPLRFVALAIADGNIDDADNSENILWDNVTKTATIIFGNRTIKFAADSDTMIVDDKSIVMENGVKAEIKDGRMFVPFRALGNALGVDVEWNADTKTATYSTK